MITPTKRKIFSIPLNPYTTAEDYEKVFVPFLSKYKEWVYDVYFTARIPPFLQDAMGAVFKEEQLVQMFQNALALEEQTGVRVSATFNNINVPPTAENLEIFVNNLQYLYDAGLRSMTMPHNHWLMTGVFQEKFPELQVKNTVLRRVATAQDFWNACEAGFDYVNIDRILLRDETTLDNIKKAQQQYEEKTGKYVPTALLANEGCRGKCPTMDEHYIINNSSGSRQPGTDKPYFYQKISQNTCPKWRLEDSAYSFKMANIPPYREDVERILTKVDILKMHGREGFGLLNDTIKFVESYVNGDDELHDISVRNQIDDLHVRPKVLGAWRNKIRDCKFECWDCHLCDELVASAQKKKDDKLGSSIDDLISGFEG
jgi:hypothetical protein